jgi:hypothetical protein
MINREQELELAMTLVSCRDSIMEILKKDYVSQYHEVGVNENIGAMYCIFALTEAYDMLNNSLVLAKGILANDYSLYS